MSNVIGELDNCKCIKEESEDNKFAEFIESQKELSLTVSVATESIIKFKRALGIKKITRKRFKKLLMGCGMQRNDAEIVADAFRESEIQYTPLAVQKVIETINIEAEKICRKVGNENV